jgi:hypothetical protein
VTVLNDCEFCGRPVVLLKDPDNLRVVRAMDPIEYHMTMPTYWTADSLGFIRPGGAMLKHQCPTADISRYIAGKATIAARIERNNKAAFARACDRCGAEPGVECWNLAERARGAQTHTRSPHETRYTPLVSEPLLPAPEQINVDDIEGAVKWATGEIDEEYT